MSFVLLLLLAGMGIAWTPLRRVAPSESLAAFALVGSALGAMLGLGVLG